jgi:hypothetical protein
MLSRPVRERRGGDGTRSVAVGSGNESQSRLEGKGIVEDVDGVSLR